MFDRAPETHSRTKVVDNATILHCERSFTATRCRYFDRSLVGPNSSVNFAACYCYGRVSISIDSTCCAIGNGALVQTNPTSSSRTNGMHSSIGNTTVAQRTNRFSKTDDGRSCRGAQITLLQLYSALLDGPTAKACSGCNLTPGHSKGSFVT